MKDQRYAAMLGVVAAVIFLMVCEPEISQAETTMSRKTTDLAYAHEIYVSPTGSDTNSGTVAEPLKTFAGARDKVRAIRGEGNIAVYFRGGYYRFSRPVRLGPEDSGAEDRMIKYCAYPGERPVFTSGEQVRGWEKITSGDPAYKALPGKAKANCYVADIPDVIKNNPDAKGFFRILIDRRNDWLERGIYSIAGQILTHWTSEYSEAVEDAKYYNPAMKKVCDLKVDVTHLANAPDATDLFTWMSDWNTSMVPIKSIEKTQEGSRIKTRVAGSYMLAGTAREYHENVDFVDSALVNAIEGIDAAGKWAVNHKRGKIYLWPFKETDLEKDIYTPTLYELVSVHGDMPEGKKAWFSKEPVKPLIWVLYVDGYGRGIEIQRNIIYNSEAIYVGFNNSYWNTYNGWKWKDFSFAASTPPQLPRSNVFVDDDIPELIGRDSNGTIAIGCKTGQTDIHNPGAEYLEDYKAISDNLNRDRFPYPKGRLPGRKRVAEVIQDVIGELEHKAEQDYKPTWKSLKRHKTPEWLSDAKFGIYTHRQPRSRDAEEFKAEKFDADAWARLFKQAGAPFGLGALEKVYDKPLDEIEAEWKQRVLGLPMDNEIFLIL